MFKFNFQFRQKSVALKSLFENRKAQNVTEVLNVFGLMKKCFDDNSDLENYRLLKRSTMQLT